MLNAKLASTEATVRSQTEKMKYYRGLLEDAGIVARSPQRSRSESNLSTLQDGSCETERARPRARSNTASASTENISNRTRELSPCAVLSPTPSLHGINLAQYQDYGNTNNMAELKEQVSTQKRLLVRMPYMCCGPSKNVNIFMSVQTVHFFRPFPPSLLSVQTNIFGFQNMGFIHNIYYTTTKINPSFEPI